MAADTRAPGVPFLAMSASVLMASGACLRASSWMLWAALGLPPGLPLDSLLKWSANHADPVLFSAISMWYLDTPRAVLAQVGNASPRTDAKHATRANSAIALATPSSTVPWRGCFSANCSRCAGSSSRSFKGHRFCIGITRMAVPVSRWPRVFLHPHNYKYVLIYKYNYIGTVGQWDSGWLRRLNPSRCPTHTRR